MCLSLLWNRGKGLKCPAILENMTWSEKVQNPQTSWDQTSLDLYSAPGSKQSGCNNIHQIKKIQHRETGLDHLRKQAYGCLDMVQCLTNNKPFYETIILVSARVRNPICLHHCDSTFSEITQILSLNEFTCWKLHQNILEHGTHTIHSESVSIFQICQTFFCKNVMSYSITWHIRPLYSWVHSLGCTRWKQAHCTLENYYPLQLQTQHTVCCKRGFNFTLFAPHYSPPTSEMNQKHTVQFVRSLALCDVPAPRYQQ